MLTTEKITIREVITHVMCNKEINWQEISTRLHIEVEELMKLIAPNKEQFDEFEIDHLLKLNNNGFTVTETGGLFIRNIAAALDPAFKKEQNNYSQSV